MRPNGRYVSFTRATNIKHIQINTQLWGTAKMVEDIESRYKQDVEEEHVGKKQKVA